MVDIKKDDINENSVFQMFSSTSAVGLGCFGDSLRTGLIKNDAVFIQIKNQIGTAHTGELIYNTSGEESLRAYIFFFIKVKITPLSKFCSNNQAIAAVQINMLNVKKRV